MKYEHQLLCVDEILAHGFLPFLPVVLTATNYATVRPGQARYTAKIINNEKSQRKTVESNKQWLT